MPPARAAGLVARFAKYLAPYRRQWVVVLILGNATAIASLLNPYIAKIAVDEMVGPKDFGSILLAGLAGAAIFLFNSGVNGLKSSVDERIGGNVRIDLNRDLFRHTHSLSIGWFRKRSSADHIYLLQNDAETAAGFLTGALPQVLWVVPKLAFTLAIVIYLNWKMALVAMAFAPFIYLPSYFFGKKLEKMQSELASGSRDVLKMLEESYSHIHLVKAFSREAPALKRYVDSLSENMRIDMKSSRWGRIGSFVDEASARAAIGILGLYGGYLVIKGSMTVGSLTAIVVYLYSLVELQYSLAAFLRDMMAASFSFGRIAAVMDEKPEISEAEDAASISIVRGGIEFEDVAFSYDGGRQVLAGVSFSIPGGRHVALAGPSGCGKTTMLNLILRLYEPSAGAIVIDGIDIRKATFASLRNRIGYVLQEPLLWNDTIENNILYGNPSAGKDEMLKAAAIAGVADFVGRVAGGYKAVIGEDACKISEGEKQKIAIARAVITDPKILILDEAMSSMDSASEDRILAKIRRELSGVTVIVVSHRLSTVTACDSVLYLRGPGEAIEGSAHDIIKAYASFSILFGSQLKGDVN